MKMAVGWLADVLVPGFVKWCATTSRARGSTYNSSRTFPSSILERYSEDVVVVRGDRLEVGEQEPERFDWVRSHRQPLSVHVLDLPYPVAVGRDGEHLERRYAEVTLVRSALKGVGVDHELAQQGRVLPEFESFHLLVADVDRRCAAIDLDEY